MINKLYRLAIISSPILAIYGIVPIYISNQFPIDLLSISCLLLSLVIMVFWFINISLLKLTKQNHLKRYLLSFLSIITLQVLLDFLAPKFIVFHTNQIGFISYRIIAICAINAIILIIINSIVLQAQKADVEKEIEKLKIINLETQKQVLLQQLQPHFLFNALSTLKSLIRDNPDQAENYSVKLSEFLRYSVQANQLEEVRLEEELSFTQDYIDLQKVRFGSALVCNIAIQPHLLRLKVPVYAIQTLIENAIKHNAFTEKKPLIISISLFENRLKVENNRSPKQLVHSSGTGLNNLNQRYLMIAGHGIEIVEQVNRFTVYLNLL